MLPREERTTKKLLKQLEHPHVLTLDELGSVAPSGAYFRFSPSSFIRYLEEERPLSNLFSA
jgi:hypothetical protein